MRLFFILLFVFSFCLNAKSEDNYLTSLKFNSLKKEKGKEYIIQKRFFSKTPSFNNCIKELLIEAIESSKYVNGASSNLPLSRKYKKEAISYINGFSELNVSTCAYSSIINEKFPGHYTFSDNLKEQSEEAIMVKRIFKKTSKTVVPKITIHFLISSLKQELLDKSIEAYTYDEDFIKSVDSKNLLGKFRENFKNENEAMSKKYGFQFNKEFESIYNSNDPYKPKIKLEETLEQLSKFSIEYSKKLVTCGYNDKVESILEKIRENKDKLTNVEFSSNQYEFVPLKIYSEKEYDKAAQQINDEYEKIGTFFDFALSMPIPSENEDSYLSEYKYILKDYRNFQKHFSQSEFDNIKNLKTAQKFLFLIYASSCQHKGPIMRSLGWTLVTVGVTTSIFACRYAWGTPGLPTALGLGVSCAVIGGVFLAWDYSLDGGGF